MNALPAGAIVRESLDELARAEILLIWSLRLRLADGPESCRLVQGFRQLFGLAEVETALACFEAVFGILTHHVVRDIGLMPPGCGRVSRDEALLLQLHAAAQRGGTAHAAEIANDLVGPVWAIILCDRVQRFAARLKQRQLTIPPRAVLTVAPVQVQHHRRSSDGRPRNLIRLEIASVPRAE